MRKILRRSTAVILLLILLAAAGVPPHAERPAAAQTGAFANSDVCADTAQAWYELDPDSGVLLRRDPQTLRAEALTEERIRQMALLDGALYLLREDGALLRYDPADGSFLPLRRFAGEIARFALTERWVYYLCGGELRRSDPDGSGDELVLREPGLYRFWLADADTVEYMCAPDEICTLRLSDGSRGTRKNEISTLDATLRGSYGIGRIKQKFPAGKYWNHCGGPNNPDGWTNEPCTHHGHNGSGCSIYPDGCNCNSFHTSIQCYGFGYKMADEYYGSTPDEWDNRIWWRPATGIKAGDVFRYKNNKHTIWITGVDGDTVTYADCNYDGTCVIRWDQKISRYTLSQTATFRDVAPTALDLSWEMDAPAVTTAQSSYYDDTVVTVCWAPVEKADEYAVSVRCNGQTTLEQRQSACSLTLDAPPAGEYVVSVTACNDGGESASGSCSFTVTHVDRQTTLALWISPRRNGAALEELLCGDSLWLNYRLFDLTTGQDADAYLRGDFEVLLTALAPDGATIGEAPFSSQIRGALPLTAEREGGYTFRASSDGAAQTQTQIELSCREPGCEDIGHSWGPGIPEDGGLRYTCRRCGKTHGLLTPPQDCGGEENCPGAVYSDMPPADDWAHEGLDFLLVNAVMNGVGDGCLAPELEINRAMLVTLLWRMEGRPAAPYLSGFEDVDPEAYYALPVAWAAHSRVVNGTSETQFSPEDPITREQLAAMLYRYARLRGFACDEQAELEAFPDAADASDYAVPALRWAVRIGLIRGVDSEGVVTLSPGSSATRAQAAAILQRLTAALVAEN